MNVRTRKSAVLFAIVVVVSVVLVTAGGCKKEEPATQRPTAPEASAQKQQAEAEQLVGEAEAKLAEATEQTTCPIMGKAIDKDIFIFVNTYLLHFMLADGTFVFFFRCGGFRGINYDIQVRAIFSQFSSFNE